MRSHETPKSPARRGFFVRIPFRGIVLNKPEGDLCLLPELRAGAEKEGVKHAKNPVARLAQISRPTPGDGSAVRQLGIGSVHAEIIGVEPACVDCVRDRRDGPSRADSVASP